MAGEIVGLYPDSRVPEEPKSMTDPTKLIARCTLCASEFSQNDLDGVNACPTCGHGGLPMPIDADVKVAVNWHELRILGMWAEQWAVQHKEKHPEMQRVVGVICGRLHAQHPKRSGLTLTAEIGDLRREFGNVETTFSEDDEANEAA